MAIDKKPTSAMITLTHILALMSMSVVLFISIGSIYHYHNQDHHLYNSDSLVSRGLNSIDTTSLKILPSVNDAAHILSFSTIINAATTAILTKDTLALSAVSSNSINIPSTERQALRDLYDSTDGPHWTYYIGSGGGAWDFSDPSVNPCDQNWYGIYCTDNHIVYIALYYNVLYGTIPEVTTN